MWSVFSYVVNFIVQAAKVILDWGLRALNYIVEKLNAYTEVLKTIQSKLTEAKTLTQRYFDWDQKAEAA